MNLRLLCVLTVLLIALLCVARLSTIRVDDDRLSLAYAGSPASSAAKSIEAELSQRLKRLENCRLADFRLTFRARYGNNYTSFVAINPLVTRTIGSFGSAYEVAVVEGLLVTQGLFFVVTLGALLLVIIKTRDERLKPALVMAMLTLAAIDLIVGSGLIREFWIVNIASPFKALLQIPYSFVFASSTHSLFGTTPRNSALCLFALALVLRLQQRPIAAAIVILAIGLFHQTYGGLALFFYCTMSAISSPQALQPLAVRVVLVTAALFAVLHDRYAAVELGPRFATAAALLLTAAGAFAAVASPRYGAARHRLLGSTLVSNPAYADALVAVSICVLVTAVALVCAANADPITRFYFWADLTTRAWSFAHFPVFLAGSIAIVALLSAAALRRLIASACALAITAIGATLLQFDGAAVARMTSDFDRQLRLRNPAELQLPRDEGWLYAHLAAVSAGQESSASVAKLLEATPIVCQDWLQAD